VNNGTVSVQDLGGENGTLVNGNRVATVQSLNDGDRLVVGTHSFVVSIKSGTARTEKSSSETNQNDFFELTPYAESETEKSDSTRSTSSNKTVMLKENARKSEQEAEIMFEVRLDGQRISVTKNRLFDLARKGSLLPDDLVVVAGTKVFADSIQGIVFGDSFSAPSPLPTQTRTQAHASPLPHPAVQAPVSQTPTASDANPFAFSDEDASSFDNITSEPFVRAVRKESAFGAIWSALDISFSRVYTMEGNNLVIHSLKALYYVIVVICFLVIFFMWLDVGRKCYEAGEEALSMFLDHFIGLAFVTFGCVMIIVVVRILLEMFLLAWIESARAEREKRDDE
jgi:hypothetical protein